MAEMTDFGAFSSSSVQVVQDVASRLRRFGDVQLEDAPRPGQPSSGARLDLVFTPRIGPLKNHTFVVEYKTTPVGRFLSSADAASAASTLSATFKADEPLHYVVITNSHIGEGARKVLEEYRIQSVASIDTAEAFVDAILSLTQVATAAEGRSQLDIKFKAK